MFWLACFHRSLSRVSSWSLQHVAKLGYKRVIVFPYFLFSGILIDRIYGFTDQVAEAYPEIERAAARVIRLDGGRIRAKAA